MQEKQSSHEVLHDQLNNYVDVIEQCGATLVDCEDADSELSALSLTFETATEKQITQAKQSAKNKLLDVSYFICLDWSRFRKSSGIHEKCSSNLFLPELKIVNDTSHCVSNCSDDPSYIVNIIGPTDNGLAFAPTAEAKSTSTRPPLTQQP